MPDLEEEEGTTFFRNVENYSPNDSVTSNKTFQQNRYENLKSRQLLLVENDAAVRLQREIKGVTHNKAKTVCQPVITTTIYF